MNTDAFSDRPQGLLLTDNCPRCDLPLVQEHDEHGLYWSCPQCGGRLVTLAVLRKTVLTGAVDLLWHEALTLHDVPGCDCPLCHYPMQIVRSAGGKSAVLVDVCSRCTVIWFDAKEYQAFPLVGDGQPPPVLPQDAREAIAMLKVQQLAQMQRDTVSDGPDEKWKIIPATLGIPVEIGDPVSQTVPWLTWSLAILVSLVSGYVLSHAPWALRTFGFIPAQAERYNGLTFLTPFFLHAGLFHLFSNMYFLLVFGNNVEDYLGRLRYVLLLVVATCAGNLAHLLGNPSSTLPCIGASGGIAGVITCYALAFPNARFAVLFRFRWVNFPAYGMVLFWVLLQGVGVWQQLHGYSNVAALAHLGGAAAGVLCWLIWRKSPTTALDYWQRLRQQTPEEQPHAPTAAPRSGRG